MAGTWNCCMTFQFCPKWKRPCCNAFIIIHHLSIVICLVSLTLWYLSNCIQLRQSLFLWWLSSAASIKALPFSEGTRGHPDRPVLLCWGFHVWQNSSWTWFVNVCKLTIVFDETIWDISEQILLNLRRLWFASSSCCSLNCFWHRLISERLADHQVVEENMFAIWLLWLWCFIEHVSTLFPSFRSLAACHHDQATLLNWFHKIIGAPSDRCAEACLLTWEYLEYQWALPYRASGAAHMELAKCYEKSRIPWKFNKFRQPQEVSKDLKLEKIREQLLCTGLKCCKAAGSPPVNASIWCDCFSRWWFAYAS